MLSIRDLSKSYDLNPILDHITFSLNRGEKAGLVGANGSGKSTLLKILAGIEKYDSGTVDIMLSVVTGYLTQAIPELTGRTISQLISEATSELRKIETEMHRIEQEMPTADADRYTKIADEYSTLSETFRLHGGYDLEYRIDYILNGLGIGNLERSRNIETLSGGEKTRLNLAMLLLKAPDLLLLDEPTNNLDLNSLAWLETYMVSHKGALIVASHDWEFLNNMVTMIFEIDEHSHQIKKYDGNYDAYKIAKDVERIKWEDEYQNQQEEIKELRKRIKTSTSSLRTTGRRRQPKDGDKFIPYFKGQRLQKSVSRSIHDAEQRLNRILANSIPKPPKPLRFKAQFKEEDIRSSAVIKAIAIDKKFGDSTILQDISFSLRYDSRIVITGPNGSGKTTLLRILTGKCPPDSGEVVYAPTVRIGYLTQEPGVFDPDLTVLDYYSRGRTGNRDDFVFDLVTCGLFIYDDLGKKLGQLSLGQVRKLEIAMVIGQEPNILILDEPTNHLSLYVLESFESALKEFKGPILSVSHDRRFIRQFGHEVWELNNGVLINL